MKKILFLTAALAAAAVPAKANQALLQLERAATAVGAPDLERQSAAAGAWADGGKQPAALQAQAGSTQASRLALDRSVSARQGHGTIWDGGDYAAGSATSRAGKIFCSAILVGGLGLIALALAVPSQGPLGIMGVFAAALGFMGLMDAIFSE